MKILVLGDLHITSNRMHLLPKADKLAAELGVQTIIQVGDFGLSWPGENCPVARYFNKRARQSRQGPDWITCLGNHDNWNTFEKNRTKAILLNAPTDDLVTFPALIPYAPGLYASNRPGYIPTYGGMLFLGGAVSTDADYRHPNHDWGTDHGHKGRVEGKDWWR